MAFIHFQKIKKVSTIYFLIFLFTCGLILRLYKINDGLIFGYDQARDAYRVTSIFKEKNFKLLGPETDIPGIHHGVGYYYLLAIPYFLSNNPVVPAISFAILNALGVFFIYVSSLAFFHNKKIATTSAIIFTISFEIIQYSRWLANPSLGIFTVLLAYLGLWIWIKGNHKGLILAMFSIALGIHFQFFLIYLYLLVPLIFLIYKPKISPLPVLIALITAIIIDSPVILSEIKFNFQATKALISFVSSQKENYSSVFDFLFSFFSRYLERTLNVIFHTLLPINKAISFFVLPLIMIILFKDREKITLKSPLSFLLIWFVSSIPLFLFSSGALSSEFSFVGIVICLILLISYAINNLSRYKLGNLSGVIILIAIIVSNARYAIIHAIDGSYIFSVQNAMTWGHEKEIVDYTYKEADGQSFSICTLTNPLFVNTTWAYIYETYGKNKYGYLPYWAGPHQDDQLGNLPVDSDHQNLRFLIFEPPTGIPPHANILFRRLENYISDNADFSFFGDFKVEKRKLLSPQQMDKRQTHYGIEKVKSDDIPINLPYRCYK